MGKIFKILTGLVALCVVAFGCVLAFGTGTPAPELASISAPFRSVDFSGLPPLRHYEIGRGGPVAYRTYGPEEAKQVVILLHGSTASSASMHPLARHLAGEGMAVYVPDIRGHGETGQRGTIDRDGQLINDLEMLVSIIRTQHGEAPLTLLGYSAGGGLAMRYGASPAGHYIDRYVFVAPALGRGAPTTKSSGDLWATPHVPRIVAISLLNRIGIDWFNDMEAIRFAVPPGSEKLLAPSYSYRLLVNLLPLDYAADLRANLRPMAAVLAEKDELFDQATLRRALMDVRSDMSVTIVPGLSHIGLILEPVGLAAISRVLNGQDVEDRPDELDPDGVKALGPGDAPPAGDQKPQGG